MDFGWFQVLQSAFVAGAFLVAGRDLWIAHIIWPWDAKRALVWASNAPRAAWLPVASAAERGLVGTVLRSLAEGSESLTHADVERALLDVQAELARVGGSVRTAARLALLSGFAGALLEVMWLFQGDFGLAGLEAGLPERLAVQRGVYSIVLGVGAVLVLGRAHRAIVLTKRELLVAAERFAVTVAQAEQRRA